MWVITKFINGNYAIIGDIEKMFDQKDPKDVDLLRLNWRDSPKNPLLDCQVNLHLFGKVDSPCIANWAFRKSGEDSTGNVKFVLNNAFYMDDYVNSLANEENWWMKSHMQKLYLLCHLMVLISKNSFLIQKLYQKYGNLEFSFPTSEWALGLFWNI